MEAHTEDNQPVKQESVSYNDQENSVEHKKNSENFEDSTQNALEQINSETNSVQQTNQLIDKQGISSQSENQLELEQNNYQESQQQDEVDQIKKLLDQNYQNSTEESSINELNNYIKNYFDQLRTKLHDLEENVLQQIDNIVLQNSYQGKLQLLEELKSSQESNEQQYTKIQQQDFIYPTNYLEVNSRIQNQFELFENLIDKHIETIFGHPIKIYFENTNEQLQLDTTKLKYIRQSINGLNEVTKMLDRQISIICPQENSNQRQKIYGIFWSGKVQELTFDNLNDLNTLSFQETLHEGRQNEQSYSAVFSKQQNLIAISNLASDQIVLVNINTKQQVNKLTGIKVSIGNNMAFCDNLNLFVAADQNYKIHCWNISSDEQEIEPIQTIKLEKNRCESLVYIPKYNQIAYSNQKTLGLLQYQNEKFQHFKTFTKSGKTCTCMVYWEESDWLITGSNSGQIDIWSLSNFEIVSLIETHKSIEQFRIIPEKKWLLTLNKSGFLVIFKLTSINLIELTEVKCQNYHLRTVEYYINQSTNKLTLLTGSDEDDVEYSETTFKLWDVQEDSNDKVELILLKKLLVSDHWIRDIKLVQE